MDERTYIRKMLGILNHSKKFKCLGNCSEHGNTAGIEKSIQALLLKLQMAGEIPEDIYKTIWPTGSVRPHMYGVTKVHKEELPIRPLLTLIYSQQHTTALHTWWNQDPKTYSQHVVKESLSFSDAIRQFLAPE